MKHTRGNFSVEFFDPKTTQKAFVASAECPSCNRPVVTLSVYAGIVYGDGTTGATNYQAARLIWPRAMGRSPLPVGVPMAIANDYSEAAFVLSMSEKASAALSRRCLQSLLREAGATKSRDLADQIEEVLPTLPGYLQTQLDAVRNIGNFAAHPQKSKATGEIIDVEPGEAEWNLDVLDLLFDFYYEQPRIAQEKRDALNKKLAAAAKPPMK
ncbi:MAG TPA: DUF4145 domain-containing protein [Candidatus Baltobacteraceae bacterium]|nr:DUF4145 domain-containing protein [Candidatus Baltobacteraceae bacterium]